MLNKLYEFRQKVISNYVNGFEYTTPHYKICIKIKTNYVAEMSYNRISGKLVGIVHFDFNNKECSPKFIPEDLYDYPFWIAEENKTSEVLPALSTFYPNGKIHNLFYLRDKYLHNEFDAPALISYDEQGNCIKFWLKNGKFYTRSDNKPNYTVQGDTLLECWFEESTSVRWEKMK